MDVEIFKNIAGHLTAIEQVTMVCGVLKHTEPTWEVRLRSSHSNRPTPSSGTYIGCDDDARTNVTDVALRMARKSDGRRSKKLFKASRLRR